MNVTRRATDQKPCMKQQHRSVTPNISRCLQMPTLRTWLEENDPEGVAFEIRGFGVNRIRRRSSSILAMLLFVPGRTRRVDGAL
jgi:hypothetical protein